MRYFLILLMMLIFTTPARAEIVSAGEPEDVRVETSPDFKYPDIYQRQLAYREKRLLLKSDLEERQKNFTSPAAEARKNYAQDLENLHSSGE